MNSNNNPAMNPMDPRALNNRELPSSNNDQKLKVLINEVKTLRKANADLQDNVNDTAETKQKYISMALLLTFSVLLALGLHECVKYFINRNMKLYGGSPMMFVYYPLLIIALFGGILYKGML
jgi:hypothetical protein